MTDRDPCPTCGEPAVAWCKCPRGDMKCAKGHHWHRCYFHGVLVPTAVGHKNPVETCTCVEINSTNDLLYSPRGRVAESEMTRDPIFLFQFRRWLCSPAIDWEEFGLTLGDEGEVYDEDGNEVSEEKLADMEINVETWITEYVFGTREESDAYGRRRSYNYRHGWRTYSVPADGQLAKLLVKYWG